MLIPLNPDRILRGKPLTADGNGNPSSAKSRFSILCVDVPTSAWGSNEHQADEHRQGSPLFSSRETPITRANLEIVTPLMDDGILGCDWTR